MEVSSEALLHNRVDGINYSIVGFTNITEDHLNIHGNIENYIASKLKLIDYLSVDGVVVYNGDDVNLCQINYDNKYSYGVNADCDFTISDIVESSKNVRFKIAYNNVVYEIESPLVGLYNVYNVTLAFAICLLSGLTSDFIIDSIKNLKPILGRRESLDFGQEYEIILDYAHTFNGIKSIIESCSNYKTIITVTGAAGGREVEKRSKIGKLVLEKSDVVVFTMDDPRYESVDKIIDDLAGDTSKEYFRIKDRVEAIHFALKVGEKNPGSVVLILGKGRDNYMAIEDKKIPYCDYDVIKDFYEK
jgi:UDP-N-acetylmuramoyl-L-alanyl-D-glutamate--2,6-diaminopimelate ligase